MLPDDDKRYAIKTCRSSESVLKKWFKNKWHTISAFVGCVIISNSTILVCICWYHHCIYSNNGSHKTYYCPTAKTVYSYKNMKDKLHRTNAINLEVRHPRCVEPELQNGKSTVKTQLYQSTEHLQAWGLPPTENPLLLTPSSPTHPITPHNNIVVFRLYFCHFTITWRYKIGVYCVFNLLAPEFVI